jgi:N-acetyl-gamma-glutamyl-phosphate reductase
MRVGRTIAVAGASGYAGGELLRLVLGHPGLGLGAVAARTAAGRPVTALHPQLPQLAGQVFAATEPGPLAEADLLFLALPHGESAALVAQLPAELAVVDLGADFRLGSAAAWSAYYSGEHAGTWPYGLPELPGQRELLAGATRVAVPGCYPTVSTLTIAPALAAGLVEPDVVVVAASGTSGAGKAAKPHLLGSETMGNASAYGVGGTHRHTPEIMQNLSRLTGGPVAVSFTPLLVPMPRGILATCSAPLTSDISAEEAYDAYAKAYADEPFVHLLPPDQWPQTKSVTGSNAVHVQVTVDLAAHRLVAVGAVDNLAKGTAGAAVQCMNLALGLDEGRGLTTIGLAP